MSRSPVSSRHSASPAGRTRSAASTASTATTSSTSSTQQRRPPRKTATVTHRVVEPNAGGADLGATHIYASVPAERTDQPVCCFETFTEDLYALAAWFKEHGVTSVAMESTGSFWIPVFQILEACGLEVVLVNGQHVKNVPGRKTDVQDCQWLQYLHSVGLLRGSFQPPKEITAVRALMRHRARLVEAGAREIQHMQQALTVMNLHLHHVLTDLSGVSGLAIIDALLQGERDPAKLAELRDRRVKASAETIQKALVGDYRAEQLFILRQAREAYQFCREQMRRCDAEVERLLADLRSQVDPKTTPPPPAKSGTTNKPRKGELVFTDHDLRTELYRILGTDVTQVPGFGSHMVCGLLAEMGPSLSDFENEHRFASWVALCPSPKISGGRVLRRGTRPVKHRVATLFRLAAQTQAQSQNALGAFYRRMRAKLGPAGAVTATAHKLARIYFRLVTTRAAYDESVFAQEEEQHLQRRLDRLKREARDLGYTLSEGSTKNVCEDPITHETSPAQGRVS